MFCLDLNLEQKKCFFLGIEILLGDVQKLRLHKGEKGGSIRGDIAQTIKTLVCSDIKWGEGVKNLKNVQR